jgi:hypothetical protein
MRTSHACSIVICSILSASVAAAQPSDRPQGPPGTVTLSLAEFDRLVDRAERPIVRPDPPPIPAVLARADLRVTIAGTRARGTFNLEGEVFRTGMTKVLLVSGATLLDARLGSGALPLLREGDTDVALIAGPRPFSLVLDWGAALMSSPGRAVVAVPVPLAGTVSATFELPGTPADVRVEPGVITRTTADGPITRIEATLVPGTQARLSWSSRQTAPTLAAAQTRVLTDVKTLVTVSEADVRLTSLIDVTLVRGELPRVEMRVPAGYTVTAASGSNLETGEGGSGVLVLMVRNPAERRQHFLVSLERSLSDAVSIQTELPSVTGAERETGEVAVEASGTVELTTDETDVLRRMDVREAGAGLRSLARRPMLAALRYHRRGAEPPVLSLHVTRFPDAAVVAAVAEQAVATTLLTADGRTLTEVSLTMRNRAHPFLRVVLPQGATMVSAEVAGEAAKLAQARDGTRVPLLRSGFRPDGPYTVSFVYLQAGQPFAKKGRTELLLPKMDVPVSMLRWEMFVPDRYRVSRFDGDALVVPAEPSAVWNFEGGVVGGVVGGIPEAPPPARVGGSVMGKGSGTSASEGSRLGAAMRGGSGGGLYQPGTGLRPLPGQIVGRVSDPSGAALPGATVLASQDGRMVAEASTNENGEYVLSGMPSGRLRVMVTIAGFQEQRADMSFEESSAKRQDFRLDLGKLSETMVAAESAAVADQRNKRDEPVAQAPSQNVFNLQRRVAGVLPVRIDVPRAGSAYRFVRPLVLDETTRVSFDYRTR